MPRLSVEKLFIDNRWIGTHGIGRFAEEVKRSGGFNDAFTRSRLKPSSPFDVFYITIWLFFHPFSTLYSPGYNAPLLFFDRFYFTIHDLNHLDFTTNGSFLKRLYYNLVIKRACRRTRVVFTVSEYSKERIAQWAGISPKKILVAGNGVSKTFSPEGDCQKLPHPFFLCVSNRRPHKNEEGTLQAFARVALKQDIELVFTGGPTPKLLQMVSDYGVGDRVRFLGTPSEEELAGWYRGAVGLLFPSFYEGFGLPVVEAMASGTPVITSDRTSLPEIAGGAAMLVDPASTDSIAAAIESLLTDGALRSGLRSAGLNRAADFSWTKVTAVVVKGISSR